MTEVLADVREGAPGAQEQLFRLVYGELRRLADAKMRDQPRDHTLTPTALVSEAYLKLLGKTESSWDDRAHFYRSAARAMRSILVDFARRRNSLKRGGKRARITLDEERHPAKDPASEVIAVHEALEKLEAIDPQRSRVVELRFFGGLSVEETAGVLGVTERTVYRDWDQARAWLYREMSK
ncbi:MAG: sigma-70 family RNA polymerase sigma factor [Planctomycetota bacterium]